MTQSKNWYDIKDVDKLDSPALVVYPKRVKENIATLISMIDDVRRLRPHVKTHKAKEAARLCMEAGILKFKCATIAEAELLAMIDAPDILIAYQPSVPKLDRLINLIKQYPGSTFSCLVDNMKSATHISEKAIIDNLEIPVYIDLNVGMNRTGIKPGDTAFELYKACNELRGIKVMGMHAYDGHIHESNMAIRMQQTEESYAPVERLRSALVESGLESPVIIAGGSPSFPIHAKRKDVECSPGTFIYWDKGYLDLFDEQHFLPAALVVTRVISLPTETTICLDLGHKSIAAENKLSHRVFFLNAPELVLVGQSEEHLVADAGAGHAWKIGDVLFGMPMHVCPTCALYDSASIIEDGVVTGSWKIIGRDRKINL